MTADELVIPDDRREILRARVRRLIAGEVYGRDGDLAVAVIDMARRYGNACQWLGHQSALVNPGEPEYYARATHRRFLALMRIATSMDQRPSGPA